MVACITVPSRSEVRNIILEYPTPLGLGFTLQVSAATPSENCSALKHFGRAYLFSHIVIQLERGSQFYCLSLLVVHIQRDIAL